MAISNAIAPSDTQYRQDLDRCLDAVDSLRTHGYAVVVFSPDELDGAEPTRVSDRLIELGWDVIDTLK